MEGNTPMTHDSTKALLFFVDNPQALRLDICQVEILARDDHVCRPAGRNILYKDHEEESLHCDSETAKTVIGKVSILLRVVA